MDSRIIAVVASIVLLGGACSIEAPAPAGTTVAGQAVSLPNAAGATAAPLAGPVIAGNRTQLSRAAAAPDHGEFASYPGAVARTTGAYTWHRAAFSEAHALNAIASGHLRLTTPDGRLLDVVYDRHIEHDSGDWTWIGHLAGQEGVQTVLTIGAEAVFGSIGQDTGLPLRLTMRDGVSWLVETDGAKVADIDSPATRPLRPDFHVPVRPRATPRMAASGAVPAGTTAAAATAANPTVDVLVGYTAGLRAAYGSASAVTTRINNLVDLTNTAYVNGGINGSVRLVHTMEVDYTDTNDNGTALSEMSGYEAGVGPTTPAAAFAGLRAARETYGADLVTLIRDFRDPEHDGCGIAWLLGGSLQGMRPGEGWDTLGYNVVSDGSDANETDGKSYFCRDATFAHELGHNMGAAHDWVTAQGGDGTVDNPDDYGAYLYSFGYKTPRTMGNFYTVMAYGDAGQTAYTIFSTPNKTFCGGNPCGMSNADNVQTLNNTMPVVAGFRPTVVEPTAVAPSWLIVDAAHNDANGDGRSDVFWHSTVNQAMQAWLMNGTAWTYGVVNPVGSQYEVAGVGDFDGNGLADILWRDTNRTQLWQWRAQPGGGYAVVFQRYYPAGWEIVGIADANADGRSDIFWHNPTERRMQKWFMNGQQWTYGIVLPTPQAKVEAIADFSGDGRADILWHDATSTVLSAWIATADDAYAASDLRYYPAGWDIVAVDDANGDGRMDIFWHNPTVQRLETWFMNGATWTYGPGAPISNQYEVAGTGDYNGDGRADIIWRDTGGTTVWMWQATNDGSYGVHFLRGYPSGWNIVH